VFVTADRLRSDRVPSGDRVIDEKIPIYVGYVYSIYGKPGSGKSNVALSYCVSAIQMGKTCTWVDTEGKFPHSRLVEVASNRGLTGWENKFQYARVRTVNELRRAVLDIVHLSAYGYVTVIDTMINPYRQDRGYQGLGRLAKRQQELAWLIGELAKYADMHRAVVFIVTHSIESPAADSDRHAGGNVLAHMTKLLKVEVVSGVRYLKAEKLPDVPPVSVPFEICGTGICHKT
jgi:RecA/RadA recombinase